MIALFARANHPEGWGFLTTLDYRNGYYRFVRPTARAHGYSLLLVQYQTNDELEEARKILNNYKQPFYGLRELGTYKKGYLGPWFGGQFDHVCSFPTDEWIPTFGEPENQVFGDNRFLGWYTFEELKNASARSEENASEDQLR